MSLYAVWVGNIPFATPRRALVDVLREAAGSAFSEPAFIMMKHRGQAEEVRPLQGGRAMKIEVSHLCGFRQSLAYSCVGVFAHTVGACKHTGLCWARLVVLMRTDATVSSGLSQTSKAACLNSQALPPRTLAAGSVLVVDDEVP